MVTRLYSFFRKKSKVIIISPSQTRRLEFHISEYLTKGEKDFNRGHFQASAKTYRLAQSPVAFRLPDKLLYSGFFVVDKQIFLAARNLLVILEFEPAIVCFRGVGKNLNQNQRVKKSIPLFI